MNQRWSAIGPKILDQERINQLLDQKMDKNSGNNRFEKFFNEILTNLDISLNTLVAYKLTRIIRIIMLYVKHIKVKIIYSIYYEKYEIQIM